MISMSIFKTKQKPEGHGNNLELNKMESDRPGISLCYTYPFFVVYSSILREIGQLDPGSNKRED